MCLSYCSHCHDQMPDKKQDRKNALERITPKWQLSYLLFCCHKKNSLKENTSGKKALIWRIVQDWGKSVRQELETIGYITSPVKSRVKQIFSCSWLLGYAYTQIALFTLSQFKAQPGGGSTHSELGLPTAINNQISPSQTYPYTNLIKTISSTETLFTGDSKLWQVDI